MSEGRRIGYYVHHHGGGHATRANSIARSLDAPVTILTSSTAEFPGLEVVRLPMDTDGGDASEGATPQELHFAPVGSEGLSGRMAWISSWIASAEPSLFVVDVSVEVTLLARLCGARVAVVRQHGVRTDPPHALAYGWAHHLLAPFPDWFEEPSAEPDLVDRTEHSGCISRFEDEARPAPPRRRGGAGRALVVAAGDSAFAALAQDIENGAPEWTVDIASPPATPERIDLDRVAAADVVVGACGSNLVNEAAYAQRGLVTWPQPRPFDEQESRGRLLDAHSMAAVVDSAPAPSAWPELLATAADRAGALASLVDGRAAGRASAALDRWAGAQMTSSTPSSGSQRTRPSSERRPSHPGAGHSPHLEKNR